jgi:RimJ/RimL family protein N-acetyltransferase
MEISPEQQRQWLRDYNNRADDFMFVVVLNSISIGCMGIRITNDVWDIYNVILGSLIHKKQGYMSKAFHEMLNFANSERDVPVTLKVLKTNPAVGWYQQNGFVISSERNDHYFMIHKR